MNIYKFSVISLLFCAVLSEQQINNVGVNEINYRLPNNTKPKNYDLTLVTRVDENDFEFSGLVIINIVVLENSNYITLHARQLDIISKRLEEGNGAKVELRPYTYNSTTEFLIIPTEQQLQKGHDYSLTIEYSGTLRTDYRGFYRSSYVNTRGETKWIATTLFEPSEARHAFPCYDEPELKASFTIHVNHGESYNAISNMREKRNKAVNGRVTTDFDKTPLMSTYLIAFIVSDFKYNEFSGTNDLPIKQRVFSSADCINQTSYALKEGADLLKAISNYLQVPYTMPKLDHAAILDYGAEAMENWGLVTYQHNFLLYDPAVHSMSRKLEISSMIAHELSHQWFGDLVTLKWWSFIWLNEGFAALFEMLAIDLVHPEWNIDNNFIVNTLQPVLRLDSHPKTHPMTFHVESPNAAVALFDDIEYDKGASVLRMFMHVLGEETFKKGLIYYLINNSYGAADENNLFENLDSAAKEEDALPNNLNVKDLFGSWSNQKGFPLVKVIRNYEDGSVNLYQEQYTVDLDPSETDSTSWWIPYNFASAKAPEFDETAPFGWIPKGQMKVSIKPNETGIAWTNNEWLLFNRQQTGFYRVLYDVENYNLINEELNDGDLNKIHPINRAQFLDDIQNFVITECLSPDILCNSLTYLKREMSYAPWETAKKAIGEWNEKLQTSGKLSNFRNVVADLVKPYYEKWTLIEAEREEVFDKLSRNTAVSLACEFGVPQCLEDTFDKFKEYISGVEISPNIRALAIAYGIRRATDEDITKLWHIYVNSRNSDERIEIISSIGSIPNDTTVGVYLNICIQDSDRTNFSSSDRLLLVTSVIESGQRGVAQSIQFLLSDLEKVNSLIGSVPTILNAIADRILTPELETQFSKLLDLANQKGLVNDENLHALKSTAREKLKWQSDKRESFEAEFFVGKCSSGSNFSSNKKNTMANNSCVEAIFVSFGLSIQ